MLVRVRDGEEVLPVLRVEAGEGGENEDTLLIADGVAGCSDIVELVVLDAGAAAGVRTVFSFCGTCCWGGGGEGWRRRRHDVY